MVDIRHKVGIAGVSVADVRRALTTIDGLSGWWIGETAGTADRLGGVIEFGARPGGFDMEVVALDDDRVRWEVVAGPDDWKATTLDFDLRPVDGYTLVFFTHGGWAESTDAVAHCSTKWATFLLSLKALLETGTGRPTPYDVKIDDWN